jgi:curved DNA-binding protein CbpA
VLGLPRTATAAEIKQAYFSLVRTHPPEREPEMFKRIRTAYERLRDPERRAETDMLLVQPWSAQGRKRRPPQPDLALKREDVIAAARAQTDLARTDWREHYGKVKL